MFGHRTLSREFRTTVAVCYAPWFHFHHLDYPWKDALDCACLTYFPLVALQLLGLHFRSVSFLLQSVHTSQDRRVDCKKKQKGTGSEPDEFARGNMEQFAIELNRISSASMRLDSIEHADQACQLPSHSNPIDPLGKEDAVRT